ncbi:thiamine phosphate synthase [Dyella psychrodurans]|uniref:Thiamine-phosphate synthase n=1 Tax=Dyella psychrodurans TaxID=1927960 RepID=A0A370WXD2_9GAMM|nr:thiamine phosphate synthase [Dyella psychrodurans]RDS80716.1 thiamine phosphate synthase [Dyella psychrodurans]
MTSLLFPGRGLYVITDGPRPDLMEAVNQALAGGARLVQYRDKTHEPKRRHAEASTLLALCREHAVPLIINDDIALAHAIDADGVHLGEADDSIAKARTALGPDAIVGVSCYDSLERAQEAARHGASYIAFGAFFASPTKPRARRASIDLLRHSATLGIPRVAIGGITPDNGEDLVAAGADYLAVISAVFGTTDIRAAAQRFTQLYSSDRAVSP